METTSLSAYYRHCEKVIDSKNGVQALRLTVALMQKNLLQVLL